MREPKKTLEDKTLQIEISNSTRGLAQLIHLVLEHPKTPGKMKDNISDALSDIYPCVDMYGSANGIELFLDAYHDRRYGADVPPSKQEAKKR